MPIDLATVNMHRFDASSERFETKDRISLNSTGTQRALLANAKAARLKPYIGCVNIACMRQAQSLVQSNDLAEPVYLSLALSDSGNLFAPPPTIQGLLSYTQLLPAALKLEWTVFNFGGNLFPLIGAIIQLGGHVSIGLGDYLYPELGTPTNADLVRHCVELARDGGRGVASPADAGKILKMSGRVE